MAKPVPTTETPARLWRVPVYLPYLQPKLTPRRIAAAEATLGVKLPLAYLDALRVQNGGYLHLGSLPDGGKVDRIAGIGPRFPSILDTDWTDVKEYMREEGIRKPAKIDDLVPFYGDGHFHYCLDYRTSGRQGEPRISYIDTESFHVDRVVAPSFVAFVNSLRAEQGEEELGLVTGAAMPTVAAALSKASGHAFKDQGDQDNGYRVFRAQLPGQGNWAFMVANRTRRGFVRKTDPDYATLRALLTDEVDRFPEHADCRYFVSADFESRAGARIARAIGTLPFPSRRVRLDG